MDESFFQENVVAVNKIVGHILFFSILVPVSFIILSSVKIWTVPLNYSLVVLGYTILVSIFVNILNYKKKFQVFSMYFGVLSTVFFVSLLGYKNVIQIMLSYSFPPMLACLYYNKKLTNITAIVNYIALIAVMWFRSMDAFSTGNHLPFFTSQLHMFINDNIGLTIEYIFVFLIANAITNRAHNTLHNFLLTREERNILFDEIQTENKKVEKLNEHLEEKNKTLEETQYKIIQFVARCLGSHDLFTGNHVTHTQKYVEVICRDLVANGYYTDELTDEKINLFKTAAFLHDIGKIHVPEGVLNKIGKFTDEEFELMKSHPIEGAKLLELLPPIENGLFNEVAKAMTFSHHEKWDGTGYPQGLSEYEIPLCARIMAAADVLDALISQRLYKEPMTIDEAMKVFEQSSGTHFEECIAQAVLNSKSIIEEIDRDFKQTENTTNAKELEWWQNYHDKLNQK